jgi:phage gpG-like protein
MIEIKVNVEAQVGEDLREFVSTLTGEGLAEINAVAGRYATNAAAEFHRKFSASGGWKGNRYMQGSTGRSGEFGENVAQGWKFIESDAEGAVIGNNADYYGFKVRGGTIRPKRVSFLTIPLIPDAKGRRAADYEIYAGVRLFRPKGKNVLMEKTEGGGVRGVYALMKSVTMQPMPGAIPPKDLLADEFTRGWLAALSDKIELL